MHALDLRSARPGAVKLGAARVVRVHEMEDDLVHVELESSAGRVRASTSAGMIRRAGVAAESDVLVVGRLEWTGDDLTFALDLIRSLPNRDGVARSGMDTLGDETVVVDLPPTLRAYLLWLLCGDHRRPLGVAGEPERHELRPAPVSGYARVLQGELADRHDTWKRGDLRSLSFRAQP